MSEQVAQNEAAARSTLDIVRATSVAGTERARVGKRPPPQKLRGFDHSVADERVVREAQQAPTDRKFETDKPPEIELSDQRKKAIANADTSDEPARAAADFTDNTSDEDSEDDISNEDVGADTSDEDEVSNAEAAPRPTKKKVKRRR